jgi:hypothetical protein
MEDDNTIRKEDLLDVIKYGHKWHAKKIKEVLDELLANKSNHLNHEFRYDHDDKYHFIYDNECYLFVFDGKIEVRCDRDNVFSSDKTFTHLIKNPKDIISAYEQFNSITMEGEEEDD